MSYVEYQVSRAEHGVKLRDWLAKRLKLSGRRAKTLLDAHNVSVNTRRVWMAGHTLKIGDTVGILEDLRNAEPSATPTRVMFQDAAYLVVDKPPGVPTNGPDSFEERLRTERGETDLIAAHRLDRDTTGCLLVARNRAAFDAVVAIFREQRVDKEYRTIVVGRLHARDRVIDAPVEGQRAISRVTTLSATTAASYLAVKTLTGRTHQIRVHLAGLRHPVLGDRQYGPPSGLTAQQMRVPRQMLHAASLSFPHPNTGKVVNVQASLPADFKECLASFKLRE